ncbi:alpha/beta hydrolase [Echinicola marina]|uniref:alpha/beta hydrolase n=1 Tax=Echinicola marina TaxID=2859768 RepID=UPI001CF6BD4B|nr:alpha/beta fold hydrolase [Echinicola marina]
MDSTSWVWSAGSLLLRKFETIFSKNRLIIAPEAMNHTYLKGFSGRVGANWMTKHQRELAIENNNRFLNAVLDKILKDFKKMPPINILGFSQGSTTSTRWAAQLTIPVNKLVLWGGGFAHDLDLSQVHNTLIHTPILLVWGKQDPSSMKNGSMSRKHY